MKLKAEDYLFVAGEMPGKGFMVFFPDLPGCISYGVTLDETIKEAQNAATGWLELEWKDNGEQL